MNYLILLLIGLAVIVFLLKIKKIDSLMFRVLYVVVAFIVIVTVVILVQPDNYIKYNSSSDLESNNTKYKKEVSQIQYLALKMKTQGFTEEQIVESFFHEYQAKYEVAQQLEKANFSLLTIKKFFINYKSSGILETRKLTKAEYMRYLVEQDIKRFASFSSEDKAKIRVMEKNKVSIDKIIKIYPNYKPNDEVKAIELGKTGKTLREVKKVFPNYEPKK